MNFLAHIYLSGTNDFIKIGNFMADSIHGKRYLEYSGDLQKGILLHRYIDTFTDAHPIYRKSKHRLHEKYGHYAGVIMDIVYDHFLSKNWSSYFNENLEVYCDKFYSLMQKNYDILTPKTQNLLPYMIDQNWLVKYASLEGLEIILFQMDYRTKHRVNMQEAIVEVKIFYTELETEFTLFFQELQLHCQQKLQELA
ncbi:ACP phosphodiesterase [Flavobacterium sp.]|uniref:acyl carrier protein phosphodiesterase n=1 Tax=Flavobacterium sp. TaxID=239 RepID=UPI003BD6EBE2